MINVNLKGCFHCEFFLWIFGDFLRRKKGFKEKLIYLTSTTELIQAVGFVYMIMPWGPAYSCE